VDEIDAPKISTVAVVVPLFDDVDGIGRCLESISNQRSARSRVLDIVVADGGSTDGSRLVVDGWARRDPRVRLIDNPDRWVPGGLNRAIEATSAEVIVRVDSHAVIDDDYIDRAVDVLQATGADVVGGGMRPASDEPFGRAVAWALSTRWGIGGSRFHLDGEEGWTDSVYMGVFRRSTFERFGLYNPTFRRNQDDELTYRIREGGGKVWLSPTIRSSYTPRADAGSLYRQFRGYGRFKPLVLLAHPSGTRPRHAVPALAAIGWGLVPLAAIRRSALLAVPATAHLVVVGLAAAQGRRSRSRFGDRAIALLAMHIGYGIGLMEGVYGLLRGERPGRPPDVSSRGEQAQLPR
jgi:glycosyltransferase involved in cell wall biosynthesis